MEMTGYQYNCSGGETFDSVAREVYGDEKYAAELLQANPTLCEKTVFGGGEAVLLPVIVQPESYTLPDSAPWR